MKLLFLAILILAVSKNVSAGEASGGGGPTKIVTYIDAEKKGTEDGGG